MAKMLLVNPRRRRRPVKTSARRVVRRRRRNPIFGPGVRTRGVTAGGRVYGRPAARRRNPIRLARRTTRRRRNPISIRGLAGGSVMSMVKQAAIGAGGAVAVDLAWGQLNSYLPMSLRTNPQTVSAGDAVKALATVVTGRLLKKYTRGWSEKMAVGALTTQLHGLLVAVLPAQMTLGYMSPAKVVRGVARIGPGSVQTRASRPGNGNPLLSAYSARGTRSPLLSSPLNAAANVAMREGVRYR